MKIAVIGAGPAGLTSAKQALERGHEVVVFEKHGEVGGIWNPASGGAYPSVRMQSSRMSFSFSDFAPLSDSAFHTLEEVHAYLRAYADHFGVTPLIRFGRSVDNVAWRQDRWLVKAGDLTVEANAVMTASGELWQARRLSGHRPQGVELLTAKDYRGPEPFAGRHVLVVGGGVSGADIAAELGEAGVEVDWSVRRKALFLPRLCGGRYNDELFSYVGRVAVEAMPYADYLTLLERVTPDHIAACRRTGLLPDKGFHNAVHVNDRIVPAVDRGQVRLRAATAAVEETGVRFVDGDHARYDVVIQCIGYGMPDYGFIEDFDRTELYEHFIHYRRPSLAVINTPVDTEAFGTACPYFEAVAGWVLRIFDGECALPSPEEMASWCAKNMHRLKDRRHYDCWLETIRLGLMSGALPDPAVRFADYWRLVSSVVAPSNLRDRDAAQTQACLDDVEMLAQMRVRLLAGLDAAARARLVAEGQVDPREAAQAARTPPAFHLAAWLPYRMREGEPGLQRLRALQPSGCA